MVVVWRSGYRIDCRTIKGGSWSVAWSYRPQRAQTIASLHHISWFLFGSLCVSKSLWSSSWQAQVHRKRSSHASSFAFSVLEVLPVFFEEGFSPFSFGPFLICLLLLFLSMLCYPLSLAFQQTWFRWIRSPFAEGSFGVLKRLQRYYRGHERM